MSGKSGADAYQQLLSHQRDTALLESCSSVLQWDEETYMPAGGVEHRGNQLALLAGMTHQRRTDARVGEWLAEVEQSEMIADPLAPPAVNTRGWRRVYNRATKVPQALVEELARAKTIAQKEWAAARKDADFARFRPWLEKILSLKRAEADAVGYDTIPYDALLDEYEPGARSRDVAEVFARLRADLVPLARQLTHAPRQPDVHLLQRDYPIDRQVIFGEAAAAAIGFDFQRGRLDITTHPFCSGLGPGDCRITTRYNSRYFNDAFFSILHEAGHGMYEQGLDPAHFGSPMGEAVSLGIHESQSRLWENAVGRSAAFWHHFFPRARQVFRSALSDVSQDAFLFAIHAVRPSLIRVDADEVTYNLHVLARFELEQALLSGDLPVTDVPAAWNEKYSNYLGITPSNDREGCLQDVHWSFGLFGYFPTYTLGNMYAAQFMAQARHDLGNLDEFFACGEYSPLLSWLRAKIHIHGQRWPAVELVRQVTGAALSHEPLLSNLRVRYGAIYGVQ